MVHLFSKPHDGQEECKLIGHVLKVAESKSEYKAILLSAILYYNEEHNSTVW